MFSSLERTLQEKVGKSVKKKNAITYDESFQVVNHSGWHAHVHEEMEVLPLKTTDF